MTFDAKHPLPLLSHPSLSLLIDITQTLCITYVQSKLYLWVFTEDGLIASQVANFMDLTDARTGRRMVIDLGGTAPLAAQVKLPQLYVIQ